MKDLGNCKTHTNHCYLGIPSGADCRNGKSDDQQFVHDDCSVDEPQLYESELRAFNCSLVGVEVTDITGILQKVNSFQSKLQCKSLNSDTWGPWKFVLIERSSN